MMVGTVVRNVTRWEVTSRRNSAGSKRGISTRCWPINNAIANVVKPVLWLIGTDISVTSSGSAPSGAPMSAGTRPSPPASISLGLPVLPPEAIDFQVGDTASGSGSSARPGPGSKSPGTQEMSPPGSRPTTSARRFSPRIASNSASGMRGDSGWGTAPSFQVASVACTHSIELCRQMVT